MADARLRVVFADDEPIARRGLDRMLRRESDIEVVAGCRNGAEALDAIRTHRPELAMLDIAMPSMSGLDVVRALEPAERPHVVFVTAFDRFAIEAFDVHAVDYLLKPFDAERFRTALSRVRERRRRRAEDGASDREARLDALLDAFDRRDSGAGRLAVKQGDRIVLLAVAEIDWCEAADNYVKVVAGGKKYFLRETMHALEQRLASRGFVRIHRSTIVNLPRVRELQPLFHGDYRVLLHDGTKLTLSRGYREAVLARIRA